VISSSLIQRADQLPQDHSFVPDTELSSEVFEWRATMSVGEICNREVIVCRQSEPLSEAVALMRDYHVGCVVVLTDSEAKSRPIGILTDRDIVVRVLLTKTDFANIKVSQVMSQELITAQQDDEVFDSLELMRDKGIRRLPVVGPEGLLEGILSVDDLIELMAEQMIDLVRLCNREQWHEQQGD
jgi:CBS domain-containing protein